MIRADLLVTGLSEVATLSKGTVPRSGPAMSELGRIPDAALAVDGGRFVFVGSARSARREVRVRRGGTEWDADGGVAVPGFVDAHTHVLFAGSRHRETTLKVRGASYAEIARGGGGLYSTVRATRSATRAALLDASVDRLRRMAANGTTTAEVKSGYALTHAGELRLLGLIPELARRTGLRLVPTFLGAHALPPEFAGRSKAYLDLLVRRTLPIVAARHLAAYCDAFCEPGFFSVAETRRLLGAARHLGLGTKIHADEFVRSGGARLAAELRVTSADHLLAATDADLRALAAAGVTAVLLPVTPFASMARFEGRGRAMVDAGAAVALGSDLSPNSWVESMPIVLAHAVYGARLTPAEALTAATVNSAHAIGLTAVAGSVAVGRDADFSVFPVGSAEEIPYRVGAVPTRVYRQGIRVSSR
ncbi:MAG TPA: imidazolonepropionase [Thermoplasmata archaeon]|nr:imidazolonepropionase [Thermoplasmata archaeon]